MLIYIGYWTLNIYYYYIKQHTGPLVVSGESGAPADQVEETPGRASLEKLGCRTPPQLHAGGVGRQQQQLTHYYRSNSLRVNPDKTHQVTAFHLRNKEANRSLKVEWNRTKLENTPHPKYLGVTLDHTLSYKEHMHNTKMKVATRNNLLRKLLNSKWGANGSTIRTTALALCYSVAEYVVLVWARSSHAQKLNPELNSACRAVTGCLKPTNVEDLYLLAGIAPPDIRRDVCARVEKTKQEPMRLTLYMVRTRQREG